MNDDLLPLEGRIEIRDDADLPGVADAQRLRRRLILATCVEGAGLELVLDGRRRAGAPGPRGRDRDESARDGISPQVGQLAERPLSMNGLIRSIGAGKTIVVDCEAPSSSSVWR